MLAGETSGGLPVAEHIVEALGGHREGADGAESGAPCLRLRHDALPGAVALALVVGVEAVEEVVERQAVAAAIHDYAFAHAFESLAKEREGGLAVRRVRGFAHFLPVDEVAEPPRREW
jgi:hypothetical protein